MRALLVFATLCVLGALAAPVARGGNRAVVHVHLKGLLSDEAIEREFVARSTPGNAKFREHLSVEQLKTVVGASPVTVAKALQYVSALAGASDVTVHATNDILSATVAAGSDAAKAFGLEGRAFFGADLPVYRRAAPAMPSALSSSARDVIVLGGAKATAIRKTAEHFSEYAAVQSQEKKAKKSAAPNLQFPGMSVTPQVISTRYKNPLTAATVPAKYSQGVGEFEASYFQQKDVEAFSQKFNLTVPEVPVVGPNTRSQDDIEGTLDVEYMTASSGAIKTWWISQNSSSTLPGNIDFAWWANEVLSVTPQPPSVVSISWGLGQYQYSLEPSVFAADNRQFRKVGLAGVSLFAASGDSGPGARRYLTCDKFMPSWPAASPYVTTVGATYINSIAGEEQAVPFSGGGFSLVDPVQPWQQTAVSAYLSNPDVKLPNATFFNRTGRAYPDVSAFGTNFQVLAPSPFGNSNWQPISGTSCASPTFAGIVSRINAERIAGGQPALGFLNPKLYQLGKVGNDIVKGANQDKDCFIFDFGGFQTAKGWDPVTGLGTPDYDYLKANL